MGEKEKAVHSVDINDTKKMENTEKNKLPDRKIV